MTVIFLFFLSFLFLGYSIDPYKRVVIIDSIRQILIICIKGIISCCKLSPKTYFLNNIKKVIIFITWKNDEKIGFNKLYFMNCDLISTDGMKESLFEDVEYDARKLSEYLTFFKKYFDTEFKPADDGNNLGIPKEEDNNIDMKPSMNEDAAIQIFA